MEFLLLSLTLIALCVAVFTRLTKTGLLTSLLALFGYFYLSAITDWQTVGLVALGLILILLEVLIPSFGLIGVLGIGSLYWGLVQTTGNTGQAALDLILALLIAAVFFVWLFRSGYVSKHSKRVVLTSTSFFNRSIESESEDSMFLKVGMTGQTVTPLRPAGKVRIDEKEVVDVITAGEHLPKDTPIEVYQIIGSKIVVREIDTH